jgi:hypothetical protein
MNVIIFEAKAFEPIQKRTTVVQQGVHDDTRTRGKRDEIRHRECGGQVEGGVFLIGGHVKRIPRSEHLRNIVCVTEAIVGLGAEHREVCERPCLGKREENQNKENKMHIRSCGTGLV